MSNSEPHRDQSAENHQFEEQDPQPAREELLDSLLNQTRQAMNETGSHELLTNYVRDHRLSSQYDFDNLTELVRCVVARTRIKEYPIDSEDAIGWIATCLYEDPIANERIELLWNSIVQRIQEST